MSNAKLLCFFICIVSTMLSPTFAKTQNLPLNIFTSLHITNGKSVTVKCAATSSISVNKSESELSAMTLDEMGIKVDENR